MFFTIQSDLDAIHWQSHTLAISETPEIRIHAIEGGPADAEQTIIFVHGFGGWASQWQAQLDCFGKTARVIAIELRGHGESDKPHSSYTSDELLHDIEQVFDQLSIRRPVNLVGHSFGAALVAEYAIRHPDAVKKIALLNASGDYSVRRWMTLPLHIPNWLFDWILGVVNAISRVFAAPSYVLKSMYWNSIDRWSEADHFSKITQPALVISPEWDPVFTPSQMHKVAELIPSSLEVKIKSWGHMTMMRRPDEVNQALAKFFALPKC